MKERIVPMFFFVLVSIVCFPAELAKAVDANDGWKLATERDGVTIYTRSHSGSLLKEFKGLGCSNRAARPELALLTRYTPIRADLFHHLLPIISARAGLGRFSPPCGNRYSNQNTTLHLSPHQLARAEAESHLVAFRYPVANDLTI